MTVAWASLPSAWLELNFWAYGAAVPELRILGMRGQPWLAWNGSWPLLWPGMGQYEVVDHHSHQVAGLEHKGRPCPDCHPMTWRR